MYVLLELSVGARINNSYYRGTDWTPLMDRYFIALMSEQVRIGSMVDQKFNKLAWTDTIAKFSAEFGSQHDKDVLKSHFMNLRKRFNDMKTLLGQSGFTWNEMKQTIRAEDDVWDANVKVIFSFKFSLHKYSFWSQQLMDCFCSYILIYEHTEIKLYQISTICFWFMEITTLDKDKITLVTLWILRTMSWKYWSLSLSLSLSPFAILPLGRHYWYNQLRTPQKIHIRGGPSENCTSLFNLRVQ